MIKIISAMIIVISQTISLDNYQIVMGDSVKNH